MGADVLFLGAVADAINRVPARCLLVGVAMMLSDYK